MALYARRRGLTKAVDHVSGHAPRVPNHTVKARTRKRREVPERGYVHVHARAPTFTAEVLPQLPFTTSPKPEEHRARGRNRDRFLVAQPIQSGHRNTHRPQSQQAKK